MQNTTQGDMENLKNAIFTEYINNITDIDLRKQLLRYETDEEAYKNDLSYSNISSQI